MIAKFNENYRRDTASAPDDSRSSAAVPLVAPAKKRKTPSKIIALSLLTAAAVFALDLISSEDTALPVFYVMVIAIAVRSPRSRFVLHTALLCSVLTIAGLIIAHPSASPLSLTFFNRTLFLLVIWLSTLLLLQQKGAERKLRRLSLVARRTNNAVLLTDRNGRIEWANEGFTRISGYRLEEVFSKTPAEVLHGQETDLATVSEVRKLAEQGKTFHVDLLHYHKSGKPYWVEVEGEPLFDDQGELNGYFTIQTDITERKEHARRLEVALKEKEVLLKEIHHRVKNNLQVISSLLGLQSRRTSRPDAIAVLQESENRIHSISLLHENLYRAPNLSEIDFRTYVQSLAEHLISSYSANPDLDVTISANGLALGADQAIPCGLIVNELLSNSIKHGFNGHHDGPKTIKVSLSELDSDRLELKVADNGRGLPEDLDIDAAKSLGLRLVSTLSRQLQADLSVERNNGTTVRVEFTRESN